MPNTRVFLTSTLSEENFASLLSQLTCPEGIDIAKANEEAGPRSVQDANLRALENCQAYLGILDSSYGAAQALELWRAEEKGVPCAIFLLEDALENNEIKRLISKAKTRETILIRQPSTHEEILQVAQEFFLSLPQAPEKVESELPQNNDVPHEETDTTEESSQHDDLTDDSATRPSGWPAVEPSAQEDSNTVPSGWTPVSRIEEDSFQEETEQEQSDSPQQETVSYTPPAEDSPVSEEEHIYQEDNSPSTIRVQSPMERTPTSNSSLPGRGAILQHLEESIQPQRRMLLRGASGLGKSTLAKTIAQEISSRFADGVIYIEVGERGLIAVENQLAREVGEELGTEHDRAIRQESLKKWYANRQTLLLLDDGGDQQLWPILSLLPEGTILLTAKELPQAFATENLQVIEIPPLTPKDGEELIQSVWPEANSIGAQALSKTVEGSPLAIMIAVANAKARNEAPEQTAQAIAVQKIERGEGLLEAAARNSLDSLSQDHKTLFGALGALPSTGFTKEAASAAADLTIEATNTLIKDLVARHFCEQIDTDWFQVPQALQTLSKNLPSYEEAPLRIAPYYRAIAKTHKDVGIKHLEAIEKNRLGILAAARTMSEYLKSLPEQKRGFFSNLFGRKPEEDERSNAAKFLVEISDFTSTFLNVRGYWKEWRELCEMGLEGTRELEDQRQEASLLLELGSITRLERDFNSAEQYLTEAMEKFELLGERSLKAHVLHNLALIRIDQKKPKEALRLLDEAISFADGDVARTWKRLKQEIEKDRAKV